MVVVVVFAPVAKTSGEKTFPLPFDRLTTTSSITKIQHFSQSVSQSLTHSFVHSVVRSFFDSASKLSIIGKSLRGQKQEEEEDEEEEEEEEKEKNES